VLQQVAGGVQVGDVCRQLGISEQTFYRWRKAYGSMLPSEARELKQVSDDSFELGVFVPQLAQTRVRFGYRRLLVLMRREGWTVGKERFYRVTTEESLALRPKRPWRHASAVHREPRRPATRATTSGAWICRRPARRWPTLSSVDDHVILDFSRRGKPTDNAPSNRSMVGFAYPRP
jgi:hypothetical protein